MERDNEINGGEALALAGIVDCSKYRFKYILPIYQWFETPWCPIDATVIPINGMQDLILSVGGMTCGR